MIKFLLFSLAVSSTSAFAPLHHPRAATTITTTTSTRLLATTNQAPAVTDYLKELLEHMDGKRLLQSSSVSWRDAIFDAVGAPHNANEELVAKALQDAMANPHNQFAILLGDEFVANFPSDPVDYDDGSCWVECRLRDKTTDDLLVTMGVSLQAGENGTWLISSLDWQDFRDEFYPGLSGREWLRAF